MQQKAPAGGRAKMRAIYAVTLVFSLSSTRPYTNACSTDFGHVLVVFVSQNGDR